MDIQSKALCREGLADSLVGLKVWKISHDPKESD